MKNALLIIVTAIGLLLTGCAPSQMSVSEENLPEIDPIGIYIIGSTQILDFGDSLHRDFTVSAAGRSVSLLFESKGYKVKELNPLLPVDAVFDKYLGSFHIDEDTVASVARKNGCSSFLIVYYAYTGQGKEIAKGLSAYNACSVYGWLCRSKDAGMIASSHTALNSYGSYRSYVMEKYPDVSERIVYRSFLEDLAGQMFAKIGDNPKK